MLQVRNNKSACPKKTRLISDFRFYNHDEINEDVLIVRDKNDRFHAIDAKCSHEGIILKLVEILLLSVRIELGGPLEQGDIEDMGNSLYVVCPWHHFDFNLDTGASSTGLQQQVYPTRVENEQLYVNFPLELRQEKFGYANDQNNNLAQESPDSKNGDKDELAAKKTLSYWAVKILNTPDPNEKADLTDKVAEMWRAGELNEIGESVPPDQPKRLDSLNVVDPAKIRRGKGGTLVGAF